MSTRDVILDAAAQVMRERGLANATTREIAKTAGFSEATLYKHFDDKASLLVAVLQERSTGFALLTRALEGKAGEGELAANLAAVASAAITFYGQNFPMLGSVFSTPDILDAHRAGIQRLNAGPQKVNEAVIAYLRAEQEGGRIRPDADLYAAAALLLGACMQHAFLGHMGWTKRRDDDEAARTFAETLVKSLASDRGAAK